MARIIRSKEGVSTPVDAREATIRLVQREGLVPKTEKFEVITAAAAPVQKGRSAEGSLDAYVGGENDEEDDQQEKVGNRGMNAWAGLGEGIMWVMYSFAMMPVLAAQFGGRAAMMQTLGLTGIFTPGMVSILGFLAIPVVTYAAFRVGVWGLNKTGQSIDRALGWKSKKVFWK